MSGDATASDSGALTIANGSVENAMLAGSIANGKLATLQFLLMQIVEQQTQ